jgi:hypothetical protein
MHVFPVLNKRSVDPKLETFPDGIENSTGNFPENRVCARALPLGSGGAGRPARVDINLNVNVNVNVNP